MSEIESTKEEIYARIVVRIKELYQDKLNSAEGDKVARNIISFCQEIINYKLLSKANRNTLNLLKLD